MNLLGIDLIIIAGLAVVSIISLMIIWKIARWKGEFDRWKREVNEWRNSAMTMDSQNFSDTVDRSSFEEYEDRETSGEELSAQQIEMALLYALTERREEACRVAGIQNDVAMIHHDLGNLLYRSKQFDEAEKEYREAISYRPDLARAHANLGFLLQRSERQEESIQEFKAALNSKEQLPDRGERITQIVKEAEI
ncbi:MAG: tetratricopeptide repeat protein [Euryarchaeota archaeon]|nr:tetratricopeptide repeat protein [Euryarchaeota archaeon]